MALLYRGYDCSWQPPDQVCLWNQGARFICRYASRDPSKNLTKAELDSALSKGLAVVVIWQEGKQQALRGWDGGVTDARDADAFVNGLGLRGIPVIFACDDDIAGYSSSQLAAVDGYYDGAASVVGGPRTGGYGSYGFMQREFGAGRIAYGMQTYAWSGSPTKWDSRVQLRQVQNNVSVCGGLIDWDEAWAPDYGQWPRPGQPATGEDEGMFAVPIPPGAGTDDSPDIGVSLDKTSYTAIGFCADAGRLGDAVVQVRVAWHGTDNVWRVSSVTLDRDHVKVVSYRPGGVRADGVSFRRQDDVPITLFPNFG